MSLVEKLTRSLDELVVEKHHLEQKVLLLEKKRLSNPEIIRSIETRFTVIAQLN